MTRVHDDDLHARRDLRRAYSLIGTLRGLSAEGSIAALHDHAALAGVTPHAAALAVIAEWIPAGESRRWVPTARAVATTAAAGRIVLRWQGRRKAHVWVHGPYGDELGARLEKAVERAVRAGATRVVVDVRSVTGADRGLDDVLARTARRLWARRGSLTVRADRTTDGGTTGAG